MSGSLMSPAPARRPRSKEGWYEHQIFHQGVLLYDAGRVELTQPAPMSPARRVTFAQQSFERYFGKADSFYRHFELALQDGTNEIAAFLLHQAAEHYYEGTLLVFTAYQPKEHSLEALGEQCAQLDAGLRGIFPMDTAGDRARFALLESAYVDARYSMTCSISREDLELLAGQVRALRTHAEQACRAHLHTLTAGTTPAP